MPTVFQGINYANIFAARYKTIAYSRDGFTFAHATEGGTIGLREPAKLSTSPKTIKDHRKRELVDALSVKIEAPFLQTTLPEFRNAYFLSKGNHNLQLQDVGLRYLNFVANTNLTGTPNGSQLVGLGWKATLSNTERKNDLTWEVLLTRSELEWMYNNMASAAPVAATGGTAVPMTAMNYQYGNFVPSNFVDIKVNTNSVGVFGDPKIEISTVAQRKDFRDRPINRFLSINAQFVMGQTAANDLLAASTNSAQDNTIVFYLENGDQVKFTNGPVSLSPAVELGEGDFFQTVNLMGDIPYNNSESAPDYIDIGVGAANVWEFKFV